jgi:hypothetical protein
VFDQPSGPQDRTQPRKLEIPFGHAFDKRGVSSSKGAVRVGPSVLDQPSRSASYLVVPGGAVAAGAGSTAPRA